MRHICVSNLTIIGSSNGLSPGRCQAIIWTNAGILIIGPLGTNCSEILIEIHTFSFEKMHLKLSSLEWQPFCLSLNVSTLHNILCCNNLCLHHQMTGINMFQCKDLLYRYIDAYKSKTDVWLSHLFMRNSYGSKMVFLFGKSLLVPYDDIRLFNFNIRTSFQVPGCPLSS